MNRVLSTILIAAITAVLSGLQIKNFCACLTGSKNQWNGKLMDALESVFGILAEIGTLIQQRTIEISKDEKKIHFHSSR